jgi:hypothetical protein
MKRIVLIVSAAALVVLGPVPDSRANSILPGIASARSRNTAVMKHYVEVDKGIWMAVKGERERRQVRFARLMESWSADQQKIALQNGWPNFRWREDYAGCVTEIWSYPDQDQEFVFQVATGKLVERRIR